MTREDVASAKRIALGGVLLFLLWSLANTVFSFSDLLTRQHQEQQDTKRFLERSRERETRLLRQNIETAKSYAAAPRTATRQPSRQKLTASALVNRLRQANAFGLVGNPERGLHCSENRGDWDYTCLFHPDPITNATWVQFGVLVDDAHVIEMSKMYPSGAFLPQPVSRSSK